MATEREQGEIRGDEGASSVRRRGVTLGAFGVLLATGAAVATAGRSASAQRPSAVPSALRAMSNPQTIELAARLQLVDAGVAPSAAPATSAGAGDDAGVFTRNRQGPPPAPNFSARCPAGMILAEGEYCTQVEQVCQRWLDADMPDPLRCAEFSTSRCIGRRRPMSVCIDQFEAPNQRGAYPQVMLTWYQARRACEARGARLCTMSEWTFACEGPDMLPYPYGYQRDTNACHLDHQTRRPDRARLGNAMTAADESARLYEASPSGTYDRCASPFGVRDMTGNVDEWTVNETGRPYNSGLKGGWWGPIRGRCRPATIAHNETFIYYQIGYRCCADPRPAAGAAGAVSVPAVVTPSAPAASAAPRR